MIVPNPFLVIPEDDSPVTWLAMVPVIPGALVKKLVDCNSSALPAIVTVPSSNVSPLIFCPPPVSEGFGVAFAMKGMVINADGAAL